MRKRQIRQGPFWLGKFGLFSNIVLLGWTLFAIVFFSFPPVLPVSKDNMNYVSVVIVGYTVYAIAYWEFKGKKEFHAVEEEESEDDIDVNESNIEIINDYHDSNSVNNIIHHHYDKVGLDTKHWNPIEIQSQLYLTCTVFFFNRMNF